MTDTRKVGQVAAGNRGKGRKKGVPNKHTATVKQALSLAFQGVGGVAALKQWAQDNQTEFYKLWSKMLPQEVTGADGGPVDIRSVILLPALTADAE